ncbi:MAG: AMP-dependent synthetase/ligase [Brevinematia bacterium]
MPLKTVRDLVNYIGIFGNKVATQMKNENEEYQKFTFEDYQTNAKIIATYFEKEKKLRKGDMVAIYSENRPEWMMAYFGIIYNGLWAVPLDARLSEWEVKNLILDCKADIIFTSLSGYENLINQPELLKHLKEIIIFDLMISGKRIPKDPKVKSFKEIIEIGRKLETKVKQNAVDEDDVASLIYTSGTTGNPKGVLLTHANFAHQFNNLPKAVPLTFEDTLLSLLPLHHTFEFSVELTCFFVGLTITYAESLKSNRMLANIKETHVTVLVAVPLIFEKIYEGIMRQLKSLPIGLKQFLLGLYYIVEGLNKITNKKAGKLIFKFLRNKANLSNIRFAVSGAAPLSTKVAKGFETIGLTLLNGYGLTEASPVVSVNRMDRKIKNQSVGIPVDEVEVKIDNPDELGNGELLVRGPNVMKGYYKKPKETKEVIDRNGWLHTGDIGKIDSEGYVYITGRKKNIIVTPSGKNVYPEEIEELLNESPFILESLVLGVPESEHSKGEYIYAYIVPDYEYFETYANINNVKITDEFVEKIIDEHVRNVSSTLADYKKIRDWKLRKEEFPKTSTRKIKRYLYTGDDFLEA